ncbi:uncharacterized protein LOC119273289 [Triticum dicoccoides]|uniref:uncharacterized protein LOC119273289 n=1 Tax=Triticum dicoccoides TaxID=85692 RepID=UPI00188DF6DE|nr:uncharacterized protein LOC119273289 [Triticum dicoccoides]
MQIYGVALGQCINREKSSVYFSTNTLDTVRQILKSTLNISEKYLGLPTAVGRITSGTFDHISERARGKMQWWFEKLLACAGRETLLKSVIQSIPTYPTFLLTKKVCKSLTSPMAKYFWSSSLDKKTMHWVSWKDLATPKCKGGMGFRDPHLFNLAMLGKHGWRFITNSNSLCARVLKVWKLKVIPKVRVFWWRVLRGILPDEATLNYRHLADVRQCKVCCSMEEDLKHALIHCPHAQRFWEEAWTWLGLRLTPLHSDTWARNITCHPQFTSDDRAKITTTMAGGVARSSTALLGSWCKPYVGVSDPLMMECLSLQDGVRFACLRGFPHVIMEVGCLELVKLWQTRHNARSIVAPLLLEIGELYVAADGAPMQRRRCCDPGLATGQAPMQRRRCCELGPPRRWSSNATHCCDPDAYMSPPAELQCNIVGAAIQGLTAERSYNATRCCDSNAQMSPSAKLQCNATGAATWASPPTEFQCNAAGAVTRTSLPMELQCNVLFNV